VGEVVPSVESAALTDYSALVGDAPDSETAALLAPKAITGVLNLPKFQNDQGVVVMENGVMREQGRTKPGFVLAWPKNVAAGASVPVVLYQHGGGGTPSGLLPHFKPYAEAGFAVIGIDLVCHGNRSCTPGGVGSDLDMVVVNELFRTRDNFRQTAADHEAVFTHLAALSDGIRALVPDAPSLDPERAFYVGFSMGAISGAGAAASTLPKGSALISGGGPFRTLIEQGVFTALVFAVFQGRPTVEKQLLYSMIQLSVDAADPATWLSRPTDPAGPVSLWVVKDDPVANMEAARVQAIAAGAVSARPATVPVTGLPEVDLPITEPTDAAAQFSVLISREYPDVSGAALHSAAHADPTTHEIIVDGFNEIAFGRKFRVAAP
jgi:pimeloyl-ACP methyl ester carboxylesterase